MIFKAVKAFVLLNLDHYCFVFSFNSFISMIYTDLGNTGQETFLDGVFNDWTWGEGAESFLKQDRLTFSAYFQAQNQVLSPHSQGPRLIKAIITEIQGLTLSTLTMYLNFSYTLVLEQTLCSCSIFRWFLYLKCIIVLTSILWVSNKNIKKQCEKYPSKIMKGKQFSCNLAIFNTLANICAGTEFISSSVLNIRCSNKLLVFCPISGKIDAFTRVNLEEFHYAGIIQIILQDENQELLPSFFFLSTLGFGLVWHGYWLPLSAWASLLRPSTIKNISFGLGLST